MKSPLFDFRTWAVIVLAQWVFIVPFQSAYAAQLVVSWKQNTESDLSHYRIYKADSVDQCTFVKDDPIDNDMIWEGSTNDATIPADEACVLVVTAVDKAGNESSPSNEVVYPPNGCPDDPDKDNPGVCGCGIADTDTDGDGTPDCLDACPTDPNKDSPGGCGCGTLDMDSDGDGIFDCNDGCPHDTAKVDPGLCGCGVEDTDTDGDGTPDCLDACFTDPFKDSPGECGCGNPDMDSDGDGTADCNDSCPGDPNKTEPGQFGCGEHDNDSDGDGTPDSTDAFPYDPAETADTDKDGIGNNADSDDDGDKMPDDWELTYGLNPLVHDADEDCDSDGIKNKDEYDGNRHPCNAEPDKPILASPEDNGTDISLTPELQTEAFFDPDNDTHARTEWQVSSNEIDFSDESLALSAKSDSRLTAVSVSEFILDLNTDYYWRARFCDNREGMSEWSDVYSFVTIDVPDLGTLDNDGDGVPDDQQVSNPSADLDNDGTSDMNQIEIRCVNTEVGNGVIAIKAGTNVDSIEAMKSIDPVRITDSSNKPDTIPLGLVSFKIGVKNQGDVAQITAYLSEPAGEDDKWYRFDPTTGWEYYSAHAVFSPDGQTVALGYQDGNFGDADGVANGVIIDTSGVGGSITPPSLPPDSNPAPSGGGGGGCFVNTSLNDFGL